MTSLRFAHIERTTKCNSFESETLVERSAKHL